MRGEGCLSNRDFGDEAPATLARHFSKPSVNRIQPSAHIACSLGMKLAFVECTLHGSSRLRHNAPPDVSQDHAITTYYSEWDSHAAATLKLVSARILKTCSGAVNFDSYTSLMWFLF